MVQSDDADDQWSDAPETLDDDQPSRPTPDTQLGPPDDRRTPVKLPENTPDVVEQTSPLESSSLPTPPLGEPMSDAASVSSLPVAHASQQEATALQRPSAMDTTRVPPNSPAPPPSPVRSSVHPTSSAQQRRHRHRSAIEVRSSNRLSGFFNNLIHRREHTQASATSGSLREEASSSLGPRTSPESNTPSRPSSPLPARPVTPPPTLPPPTLYDLGLSLSVMTQDLSPSHFSTSPWSGTFLAPHFLLLCHAQGLDVLPLQSPPAPQPYALVRRVSFKSVVVMEQRGVLVAIAGRRDGVRVYALEEVKKAVEWRIDVEIRRERERHRREQAKKPTLGSIEVIAIGGSRDSGDKPMKASLSTPPLNDSIIRGKLARKGSRSSFASSQALPAVLPPTPLIPRRATTRSKKRPRTNPTPPTGSGASAPSGHPPPYVHAPEPQPNDSPGLRPSPSIVSLQARTRSNSVSNVLSVGSFSRRNTTSSQRSLDPDAKPDREESSDDEAINVVTAGSSGSQALDERTSAMNASSSTSNAGAPPPLNQSLSASTARRNRPANLDLSLALPHGSIPPPEPSPAPTLLTLRQALSASPSSRNSRLPPEAPQPLAASNPEDDDDDDDVDGEISLAQALFESRIPELPPLGSTRPQQPILIPSSHPETNGDEEPSSPRPSDAHSTLTSNTEPGSWANRRRRWSLMLGSRSNTSFQSMAPTSSTSTPVLSPSPTHDRTTRHSPSSSSLDTRLRQSSNSTPSATPAVSETPLLPISTSSTPPLSVHSRSRFLPRIISNALTSRRGDHHPLETTRNPDAEVLRKTSNTPLSPHVPPPKLEYVKLPGTKGALLIKAVETAKKSFLAILCGDNGEKVELFAGTYRTALGLSRTFILPDSPRSLELQLQGDDLVEVFLVFSQNVFGLEPATVRVREVRIGRAERRAARRRARELRSGDPNSANEPDAPGDEDTNVNVNIGLSVTVNGDSGSDPSPLAAPSQHPDDNQVQHEPFIPSAHAHADEVVALATAHMGPYTTFQQLSFTPKFPLASIADDYIIPPTYPDFLNYRQEYESESNGSSTSGLSQVQFSPPGLPVPPPTAPTKWYYRDPKNVIHGPWKASLMQAWYKDGLLPPDLPVRREEDAGFMLLKDLRLQCVDPTQPFHTSRPSPSVPSQMTEAEKPLLPPISLLAQPRHFGPPALFFSSRGGHSTAIVDNRGRSVLKGRFMWSDDEEDVSLALAGRMGDIKRLEAFDVDDRSVLVAMRQGGLEAVDLSDALLKPGDESRTTVPNFDPPPSNINRRGPFVWKIGMPVASPVHGSTVLSSKTKSSHTIIPGKRQPLSQSRSPAGRSDCSVNDPDIESHQEMLFLGRKDDEIYICERNSGTFRILRLCPSQP